MKKLYILLLLIYLNSYTFSQVGWIQQIYGPTYGINSIFFIDQNTGWAAFYGTNGFISSGYIARTTDGGSNWSSALGGNVSFQDIKYINNQTGWAIGNASNDIGVISHNIYKSTNGGTGYVLQYADSLQPYFLKLSAIDQNNVVCIKNIGDALRTSNGGVNWNPVNLGAVVLIDLCFINNTGWILGASNRVFKTTNSGVNWSQISQFSANYPGSINFINESTGFIADENLYKSTNGGINWLVVSPIGITAKKIYFTNEMQGWATGASGMIRYTSNGGLNWVTQNTVSNYSSITINSIHFVNNNTGWCSGYGTLIYPNLLGLILKTTNAGITELNPISSQNPNQFSLSQNYPNPFNPLTKIKFNIPLSRGVDAFGGRGMLTKLSVYDILGREVTILVNQQLQPGTYEVDWNASAFPSGVYFYKLTFCDPSSSSGLGFTETKKLILLK